MKELNAMNNKILIIGGMGPQASLTLHQKIIEASVKHGAKRASDFPEITHFSTPVPESIDKQSELQQTLKVIKEHLYCLWHQKIYARNHCV